MSKNESARDRSEAIGAGQVGAAGLPKETLRKAPRKGNVLFPPKGRKNDPSGGEVV